MEDTMLQRRFHAKRAKNQEKDENVVQAEGFFQHIAGQEFQSRATAMSYENPETKGKRQQHPHCAPHRRLRKGNAMGAPMSSKIECQRGDDKCVEDGPKSGRTHQCVFCSEVSGAFKSESSMLAVLAGGTAMPTSQCKRKSPASAGVSRLEIQYWPGLRLLKAARPLRLVTAVAAR